MSAKKTITENEPISEQEQQWIDELKSIHGSRLMRANLNDLDLLRFTRAYINELEPKQKTFEVVEAYIKWYEEDKVAEIATADLPDIEKFQKMWPSKIVGVTKDGHCVLRDEVGKMDPSTFAKSFTAEQYIQFHIQMMEHLQQTKRELTESLGKPIYKHIVVLDLDGFGFSHIWDRTLLEKMAQLDTLRYPETLYNMYIINPPFLFKALYAIASPMMDETTKSRIHVIKNIKDLNQHIQYADDSDEIMKDLKQKYAANLEKNLQRAAEYDAEQGKNGEEIIPIDEKKNEEDVLADQKKDEEDVLADQKKDEEGVLADQKKDEEEPLLADQKKDEDVPASSDEVLAKAE